MPAKPILVTGAHRSGSTWVGKMIAASPQVIYIHEPFNVAFPDPVVCTAKFEHWYTYLTAENAAPYRASLARTLSLRHNFWPFLAACARKPRKAARLSAAFLRSYQNGPAGKRALMKDPLAFFSAGWLAQEFDMQVVALIRHPAAFAASIKEKRWGHPFSHFLAQPLLMRDFLGPYEAELREFVTEEHDLADQAALLWKLVYSAVPTYQQQHPDWIFLRHEDLSQDPVSGFGDLYRRLGLAFGPHEEAEITQHNRPDSAPKTNQERRITRDSQSNIRKWKSVLTEDEIARVRARAGDLADRFYTAGEW